MDFITSVKKGKTIPIVARNVFNYIPQNRIQEQKVGCGDLSLINVKNSLNSASFYSQRFKIFNVFSAAIFISECLSWVYDSAMLTISGVVISI